MSKQQVWEDWEEAADLDIEPVGLKGPEVKKQTSIKTNNVQIENTSLNYTEYKPQIKLLTRNNNNKIQVNEIQKQTKVEDIEKSLLLRQLEYEKARQRIFNEYKDNKKD